MENRDEEKSAADTLYLGLLGIACMILVFIILWLPAFFLHIEWLLITTKAWMFCFAAAAVFCFMVALFKWITAPREDPKPA